jgi:hypothetical protein
MWRAIVFAAMLVLAACGDNTKPAGGAPHDAADGAGSDAAIPNALGPCLDRPAAAPPNGVLPCELISPAFQAERSR